MNGGLYDLGYKRCDFTWFNSRNGGNEIRERLDRALANEKWRNLYPKAVLTHEISAYSDNLSIFLSSEVVDY